MDVRLPGVEPLRGDERLLRPAGRWACRCRRQAHPLHSLASGGAVARRCANHYAGCEVHPRPRSIEHTVSRILVVVGIGRDLKRAGNSLPAWERANSIELHSLRLVSDHAGPLLGRQGPDPGRARTAAGQRSLPDRRGQAGTAYPLRAGSRLLGTRHPRQQGPVQLRSDPLRCQSGCDRRPRGVPQGIDRCLDRTDIRYWATGYDIPAGTRAGW